MLHFSLSLMNRLNKTEPAISITLIWFGCSRGIDFNHISFNIFTLMSMTVDMLPFLFLAYQTGFSAVFTGARKSHLKPGVLWMRWCHSAVMNSVVQCLVFSRKAMRDVTLPGKIFYLLLFCTPLPNMVYCSI